MDFVFNDLTVFRSIRSELLNLTDNVIGVGIIICIVFVCGIVTYGTSYNV